jgi:hypothetical protein
MFCLFSAGLENIQLLDDVGSDSAISMGSASPHQDSADLMDLSSFDGLEGATGGSDFDVLDYGHRLTHDTTEYGQHQRVHTHSMSSGGAEVRKKSVFVIGGFHGHVFVLILSIGRSDEREWTILEDAQYEQRWRWGKWVSFF